MKENIINDMYVKCVVSRIVSASPYDALKIFAENHNILHDIYFVFVRPNEKNYAEVVDSLNLKDLDVISFFTSNNLYFLNKNSFSSMTYGANYRVVSELNITLDTQILSYLYRYAKNQKAGIPMNIDQVIRLIKERHWGIESFPYFYENCLFNKDFVCSDFYKENKLAFEKYFFDDIAASKYVEHLLELEKNLFNTNYIIYLQRQYRLFYLYLLVIVDLQLNTNLLLYEKEKKLFEYFHNQIGIMCDREINLGKLYFKYGQQISFFGKIQKGRKDLVSVIANMAWDIFHLHFAINSIGHQSEDVADFLLPLFVTYDKRLKDIIGIYKVKSVAFERGTHKSWPCYVTNIIDPELYHNYLTSNAYMERQLLLEKETEESVLKNVNDQIRIFEKKLMY